MIGAKIKGYLNLGYHHLKAEAELKKSIPSCLMTLLQTGMNECLKSESG